MKAIFLYTELADYTMMCFKTHLEKHPQDEIHVVHYPVNPEAPFKLMSMSGLNLYNKENVDTMFLWEMFLKIKPDVVLCSGWNDSFYNKFVKNVKDQVPVILCFDNIFRYTIKQIAGLPLARMMFRRAFAGVWVPGEKQTPFARLIGFKNDRIFRGFYSTDNKTFDLWYKTALDQKKKHFPKRFLCVARYIPQKGLNLLWAAFAELCAEMDHDWELWCAGSGEQFENRHIHPRIKHLGFVQPAEFNYLVEECGVFVLPSLFEPWGVVVNEFAAAGFPLLLSNKVGSKDTYLSENENGWSFESGSKKDLKEKLKQIILTTPEDLLTMGDLSNKMGKENSAEMWSATLTKLSNLPHSG